MTRRQSLLLTTLAVLAGVALGWSLRQIREAREIREEPRVHLREFPAQNDRDIQETPEGLVFHL